MDTSKEYIEMCKKAEMIQEEWVASDWDYIAVIKYDMVDVITGTETDGGLYGYNSYHVNDDKKSFVWLPRQDQLQELIYRDRLNLPVKCGEFIEWAVDTGTIATPMNCFGFATFEQLWLEYAMQKLDGKTWVNNEWVKA